MTTTAPEDRLILALDLQDVAAARTVVRETAGLVGWYKIGLELIYAGGLELARELVAEGRRVFLDAKLLDIDNTVAGAVRSIAAIGTDLLTIHAYPRTMAAAAAARDAAGGRTRLLAVTVLTSLDDGDLAAAGYASGAGALVERRVLQARDAGIDGIVCSPLEVARLRALVGPEFLIVTPGVRPAGAAAGDQRRVATPAAAIAAGADLLVIGRPIVAAPDRRAAAAAILAEIAATATAA